MTVPSRRRGRPIEEPATSGSLERRESWNGLRPGDPVVVSGLRLRGATWEFQAHTVNHRNGTESVEVVGGRDGERSVRSFEPDRIYAVRGGRRRSSPAVGTGERSLAEEPQLPLR
ncbi:MAG: hypothetical protein ACYCVN_14185 [Acidimicrobiales bacterium]